MGLVERCIAANEREYRGGDVSVDVSKWMYEVSRRLIALEAIQGPEVKDLDASLIEYFYGPLAPYHIGRLQWALEHAREQINNGDWWGELHHLLTQLQENMPPDRQSECRAWEPKCSLCRGTGQSESPSHPVGTCLRCQGTGFPAIKPGSSI